MNNLIKKAASVIAGIIAAVAVFGVIAMLLNEQVILQSAKAENFHSADKPEILKKYPEAKLHVLSYSKRKMAIVQEIKKNGGKVDEIGVYSEADKKLTNVKEVTTADCRALAWSYNDKFLAVDSGSTMEGKIYIIDMSTYQQKLEVENAGYMWSTDNDYLAVSTIDNTMKSEVATKLDGATGMTVYNMDTLKKHLVLSASASYVYEPLTLDSNKIIITRMIPIRCSMTTVTSKLPKI